MHDIFITTWVYYWPKIENIVLINSETLFMLATLEGSSGRKLCVNKFDAIAEHDLIYLGEL